MAPTDDPTGAREFTTPDGMKMWIPAGQVDAARQTKQEGIRPMANEKSDSANDLKVARESGLYQIGSGVFRYFRGDKLPNGAVFLKDGVPKPTPKRTGRRPKVAPKPATE